MADQSHIYAGVAGYFGKPDHPGKVGVFRRAAGSGDWQHVLGNVQAFKCKAPCSPSLLAVFCFRQHFANALGALCGQCHHICIVQIQVRRRGL